MVSHLYLIAAMIIVGSSVPAGKMLVSDMPVYLSMTLRFLIGSACLYLFIRWRNIRLMPLGIRVQMLIAFQSVLGSVLFTLFLLRGLRSLSASASGIISGTLPVVVLLLSVLLTGERLSRYGVASVLASSAGVMLININGDGGFSATISGVIFVMIAVACEAGFLLLRKKMPLELSSIVLSLYVSAYGFLFFLPLGVVEYFDRGYAGLSFSGYLLIAYYGIFITAVAYILWFKGIADVGGARASVYTAVMPVSAVVLSGLFLGESLSLHHWVGLVLVVSAMLIIAFRR